MAIHDMAIQKLNVALCMDRAGLSGDDGPTHHGLFDIGYLRHIPNWVHMQPKNEDEFVDMLWTMANYNAGPIAIRYPRGAGTGACQVSARSASSPPSRGGKRCCPFGPRPRRRNRLRLSGSDTPHNVPAAELLRGYRPLKQIKIWLCFDYANRLQAN